MSATSGSLGASTRSRSCSSVFPSRYGTNRSGQSHKPKVEAIKQALQGVERVIIATDPGREGSMIAWEVLEHLGYRGSRGPPQARRAR